MCQVDFVLGKENESSNRWEPEQKWFLILFLLYLWAGQVLLKG